MQQAHSPSDNGSCHEAMNEGEEHRGKGHCRIGYGKIYLVGAPAQQLKGEDTHGNRCEHPTGKLVIDMALVEFRGDGERAQATSASIKEPSNAFPRLRAL